MTLANLYQQIDLSLQQLRHDIWYDEQTGGWVCILAVVAVIWFWRQYNAL